jgi:hypothetical protein
MNVAPKFLQVVRRSMREVREKIDKKNYLHQVRSEARLSPER